MFNNNLQWYVLAKGLFNGCELWVEAKEGTAFSYKLQGLCTNMFGKEETVQMHQLEK